MYRLSPPLAPPSYPTYQPVSSVADFSAAVALSAHRLLFASLIVRSAVDVRQSRRIAAHNPRRLSCARSLRRRWTQYPPGPARPPRHETAAHKVARSASSLSTMLLSAFKLALIWAGLRSTSMIFKLCSASFRAFNRAPSNSSSSASFTDCPFLVLVFHQILHASICCLFR